MSDDACSTHSQATRLVHAGREDGRSQGWHAVPIDLSSTYPTPDPAQAAASLDAFVEGAANAPNAVYARLHNGTVARFEQALAALEESEAAVAFGSGMAALSAVLLAIAATGQRHVVAVRPLYGGTDHLLQTGLLGTEVSWADADNIAAALRPDTGLVLLETPANPTLAEIDIAAVVAQAGAVPVLVDSTFATPILQQPLRHGAQLVLHSATKFLGGHGDVLAGVVACNEAWAARLRQVRILTGAVLHPLAAYLLLRGMATLRLRVLAAQANAQILAERLHAHPLVRTVHYPGLHATAARCQLSGPGCVLAFTPAGDEHDADALVAALQLITPAVSLGSIDSLIQRPAGLTHRVVDEADRRAGGIAPNLLRLSVGIEDVEDLWSDLQQALARLPQAKPAKAA
ncbi:MAG: aminotransferase class I/II-fold pyridoxal phosphate-dependent enzyme [Xanthomonadales bacterium]|nr:aminotransferase class I/II-fold pyridoxal phosphate-dependent enzyme [Xanthomonadales bacterium]